MFLHELWELVLCRNGSVSETTNNALAQNDVYIKNGNSSNSWNLVSFLVYQGMCNARCHFNIKIEDQSPMTLLSFASYYVRPVAMYVLLK